MAFLLLKLSSMFSAIADKIAKKIPGIADKEIANMEKSLKLVDIKLNENLMEEQTKEAKIRREYTKSLSGENEEEEEEGTTSEIPFPQDPPLSRYPDREAAAGGGKYIKEIKKLHREGQRILNRTRNKIESFLNNKNRTKKYDKNKKKKSKRTIK